MQYIKRSFIILMVLALLAASSYCVVTATSEIAAKISKTIISYLVDKDPAYAGKRIEIGYKYADRTFRDMKARKGVVTFAVAELYPDFKPLGNIIVPIQVIVDGEPKEKLFIRTKVSVYDRIVVATKRLKRGDLIGSTEAVLESRDIAVLNSSVIKDIDLVLGKEAKTYIPQNNPIYDWMIKDRPSVKKNEKVRIVAAGENVMVEAAGMSMEDGLPGSQVRVKNLTSGKELIATVTGTGEVVVK